MLSVKQNVNLIIFSHSDYIKKIQKKKKFAIARKRKNNKERNMLPLFITGDGCESKVANP